jgi:uncharacterized membrane protein YedE/YeeE
MSPRPHIGAAVAGLAFGASLTFIGFWDYGEVHRMFTLRDLRLLYTFAGAVALCALGFAALRARVPRRRLTAPMLVGAALFGLGWALTGACPAAALVQLGHGIAPASASLAGMAAGMWLFGRLRRRRPSWDAGFCDSE